MMTQPNKINGANTRRATSVANANALGRRASLKSVARLQVAVQ
jgi:hypothetical protein